MKLTATAIAGVFVADTGVYSDERGEFSRLFCAQELDMALDGRRVVQINRSLTRNRGAVRGLHYQRPPHAETKLVRCLAGRVFDVAVDLRAGSPTYLQYHAEELSPGSRKMLIIPEGCAHGFQTLEPDSELLYLHTGFYTPSAEGGLRYDDATLAIAWPLPPTDLSQRDQNHPLHTDQFEAIAA